MPEYHSEVEEIEFKAGEYLFHENDKSFYFYIIQEGEVEVYKTGRDNKKIPLAVIESGQSIGEFAMIDKSARSATARALTDLVCIKISEDAYETLLKELPVWATAVMEGLVQRIRHTNDIIRRYGIVDEKIMLKIEAIEFDPDAPTKIDEDILGESRDN